MALREEFETLRGSELLACLPAVEVPCHETSDAACLCRHPVVSVHMMAYNHEPYIRQAIEGVLMQETDFEYELVIGEDCSDDRTREICFECQRSHPEKVRVLWSEQNVYAIGGNFVRIMSKCRGEYVAFCEGDDYWTDPRKLQKQVDAMRRNPKATLCFTGADIWEMEADTHRPWNASRSYVPGLIPGAVFAQTHLWGRNPKSPSGDYSFVITATTLFRRSAYEQAVARFELMRWRLCLGDSQTWLGLAALGDVIYLEDSTAVYRRNAGGLTNTAMDKVGRDATLVRLYFGCEVFRSAVRHLPTFWLNATAVSILTWQSGKSPAEIRAAYRRFLSTRYAFLFRRLWALPVRLAFRLGFAAPVLTNNLRRLYNFKPIKLLYR